MLVTTLTSLNSGIKFNEVCMQRAWRCYVILKSLYTENNRVGIERKRKVCESKKIESVG